MKVKHKELPHNYVPEMMRLINLFSASTSNCACVFFLLTQAPSPKPAVERREAYSNLNGQRSELIAYRIKCAVESIFTQHDRAEIHQLLLIVTSLVLSHECVQTTERTNHFVNAKREWQ